MWLKIKRSGLGKPQVLVHGSTYQGKPFWYRFFKAAAFSQPLGSIGLFTQPLGPIGSNIEMGSSTLHTRLPSGASCRTPNVGACLAVLFLVCLNCGTS